MFSIFLWAQLDLPLELLNSDDTIYLTWDRESHYMGGLDCG